MSTEFVHSNGSTSRLPGPRVGRKHDDLQAGIRTAQAAFDEHQDAILALGRAATLLADDNDSSTPFRHAPAMALITEALVGEAIQFAVARVRLADACFDMETFLAVND